MTTVLDEPILGIHDDLPDSVFVIADGPRHAFYVADGVHGLQAFVCNLLATRMAKAMAKSLGGNYTPRHVSFEQARQIAKIKPPANAVFIFYTLSEFDIHYVR